jgi:hypothetical protein
MHLKSLITLFSVVAVLGCGQSYKSTERPRAPVSVEPVSAPVVLSPGDLLLPDAGGPFVDEKTELDFYDSTTGSIKRCTLYYGVKLTYLGTHGEYAGAMVTEANEGVGQNKLKSPLCAVSALLVLRSDTATSWKQNFIAMQERKNNIEEEKRKKTVAAQEIIRNR